MILKTREDRLQFLADCYEQIQRASQRHNVSPDAYYGEGELTSKLPIKIVMSEDAAANDDGVAYMVTVYNAVSKYIDANQYELDTLIPENFESIHFDERSTEFLRRYGFKQDVGSYLPAANLNQKLAYRIPLEQVVSERYSDDRFEPGDVKGTKFFNDFIARLGVVNELRYTGPRVAIRDKVLDVAKEYFKLDDEHAEKFVIAYNQSTLTVLFNSLIGEVGPEGTVGRKFLRVPTRFKVYSWLENDEVYLKTCLNEFTVCRLNSDLEDCKAGEMPAIVEATYQYKIKDEVPGFQLLHIDTSNEDIKHALTGKPMTVELLEKYCQPPSKKIERNQDLVASIYALRKDLDELGYLHPLAESARDVLVQVEALEKVKGHGKVPTETLIEVLNNTRELIAPPQDNKQSLSERAANYGELSQKIKTRGGLKVLGGVMGILAVTACVAACVVAMIFVPPLIAGAVTAAALLATQISVCSVVGVGSLLGGYGIFSKISSGKQCYQLEKSQLGKSMQVMKVTAENEGGVQPRL